MEGRFEAQYTGMDIDSRPNAVTPDGTYSVIIDYTGEGPFNNSSFRATWFIRNDKNVDYEEAKERALWYANKGLERISNKIYLENLPALFRVAHNIGVEISVEEASRNFPQSVGGL
jgi:hypothetical protein